MKRAIERAGKDAVLRELKERNISAQLVAQGRISVILINHKITLIVKTKSGRAWPSCKGISDSASLLILVDFYEKDLSERPDFYMLTTEEWGSFVRLFEQRYKARRPRSKTRIENNILVLEDEITKSGKPFRGVTVRVPDVEQYREKWEKIIDLLD